ncbi:hypothetical protein HP548_03285 [Paenibacillus taichungensis]|uniref:Uncharacterized protein n=1 Tax=Paenibacillus taichungensis TaxID=484184 RepID=A0ABX2MDV2_9BACL|nr:hypothetical protein [Paenibacillus taichungensis]NUU53118.1 hypothetical protein [Paenibacillus taichungensis]
MNQTQQQICEFVAGIQAYVSPVNVINPWRDYVTGYDISPEAVGYQGARFSGVPLTFEWMVTGNHSLVNQMIFSGEAGHPNKPAQYRQT